MAGTVLALVLAMTLAQERAADAQTDLAAAKALYASASYEEALSRLSSNDPTAAAEQVEQYRALCLLALGRTAEAQRSFERMVADKPLYRIPASEVSPRVVTMFHDVRRRLLPGVSRDRYVQAKARFDKKDYEAAAAQLRELLAILADDDMAEQAAGLLDLKQLGEGFLRLSEAELAATVKPVPPGLSTSAAPLLVETPPTRTVYSSVDTDVNAPVEIDRKMPVWNRPESFPRSAVYRGFLEVVIDERGAVESATIRRSIAPFYDASLLGATKQWRFRPARKNGEAVKYRKTYEITLTPG